MAAERAGSGPGGQGKAIPVEETAVQLSLPVATAEDPQGATRRKTRDRLGAVRAGAPKAIGTTGTAASATMEEVAKRLTSALLKVASNKGAPGPDGQTIEALCEQWPVVLPRLQADLLEGTYRPGVIRRRYIPKAGGGQRGLGIPTVTSYPKVVQRVFGFVGGHASVSSACRRAARGSVCASFPDGSGVRVRRRPGTERGVAGGRDRSRPGAGGAAVDVGGAGRRRGSARRDRQREGRSALLANHLQADDCFWVGRVECAAAARASAAAWVRCGGSRGHVAWRAVEQGSAVLERGVSLSAWRAARPVLVSGDLQRSAQPHDLCAGGSRGCRGGACGADAAQRRVAGGDLVDQSGAAEAAGVGVMAGGLHRRRGGCCCGKHGRVGAAGGWGRC